MKKNSAPYPHFIDSKGRYLGTSLYILRVVLKESENHNNNVKSAFLAKKTRYTKCDC